MFFFSDGILRTCIWGRYRCLVDAQVGVLISRRKCQQMNPVYNKIVNMTKHSSHSFCYTTHRSISHFKSYTWIPHFIFHGVVTHIYDGQKKSNPQSGFDVSTNDWIFNLISGSRTHCCEILLNFHRSHCCRWHWFILIPELHITPIRSSRYFQGQIIPGLKLHLVQTKQ